MVRSLVLLLSLTAALPGVVAAAADDRAVAPADSPWSGAWTLDPAASDPLERILLAQGVPKAKRLLVRNLRLTQNLVDHGDRLDVEMVGPRTRHGTLIFDERERTRDSDLGPVHYRAKRDPSGAVVLISRPVNGSGVVTVVTRTLESDGQTLRQVITVKGGPTGPVEAILVFHRAS